MKQANVLHFDCSFGLHEAFWTTRVLGALQSCKSQTLKTRHSQWDRRRYRGLTLGDLAVAVGTKLTMVHLVVRRVDDRLRQIDRKLRSDRAEVEACIREGAAYRLSDRDLGHEAMLDFDSFLFESRSAYEITVTFVQRFFDLILGKRLAKGSAKEAVEAALRKRAAQTGWIDQLRKTRNRLIHERVAWLALEDTKRKKLRFDPVLLTRTVDRLEDDPNRVSIHECRSIWHGFVGSYGHMEAWLKQEIASADAANN